MPDIDLINLNMMFARHDSLFDRQVYFPIGPLTLTGVLERVGVKVRFLDYQLNRSLDLFAEGALLDWYLRVFKGRSARVIGISCMSNLLPFAVLAARDLQRRTGARILLGGAGPTGVAQGLVDAFPWIEAAFKGEAENSLVEYLGEETQTVPGACRRDATGKDALRTRDLDSLPLVPEVVQRHYPPSAIEDDRAGVSIITSRGCAYKCTFCTIDAGFNFSVMMRSVESVVDEIERWHALGKDVILFQDDIFTRNTRRVAKLCEAFRRLPFRFKWKCFGHVNHVNAEMLAEMAAAGCVQIRYGIESGSNRMLGLIDKRFSIEKALEVVRTSCRFLPSVHVSFIYGFPDERDEDFEATVAAAKACRTAGATVMTFMLSPLPATKIYQQQRLALDFSPHLTPEYVSSGHEVVFAEEQIVLPAHEYIFDFIAAHADVFPGFYHYQYQESIRPKVQRLIEEDLRFMQRKEIASDHYTRVDL